MEIYANKIIITNSIEILYLIYNIIIFYKYLKFFPQNFINNLHKTRYKQKTLETKKCEYNLNDIIL